MQVVRINKAVCSFTELMRAESPKAVKDLTSKFSYPERGGHFVQSPLTRMKGTASRLRDLYLDTELLLRYTRMSLSTRRAFVRSIWQALDKAEVNLLETEVPWGYTHTRQVTATRYAIENTRTFVLRITMPKQ